MQCRALACNGSKQAEGWDYFFHFHSAGFIISAMQQWKTFPRARSVDPSIAHRTCLRSDAVFTTEFWANFPERVLCIYYASCGTLMCIVSLPQGCYENFRCTFSFALTCLTMISRVTTVSFIIVLPSINEGLSVILAQCNLYAENLFRC